MAPMPQSISLPAALGHEPADKRIAILREVGACGSISQAARAVGVSYKAAWQAIDTLTNLAGVPLVARAVGGAGGGGAALTAAGSELLAAADAMAQARAAVLSQWQAMPQTGAALGRLAVRTSMRNQLPCLVQRLEVLGQIVRVHLVLDAAQMDAADTAPDGRADPHLSLVARITRESAELLGLAVGQSVQALCKATAVRVVRGAAAVAPLNASCGLLRARATRVVRGAVGDEVAAELWGAMPLGLQLVGFADPSSGIRAGSRVLLVVEENAVVLAPA